MNDVIVYNKNENRGFAKACVMYFGAQILFQLTNGTSVNTIGKIVTLGLFLAYSLFGTRNHLVDGRKIRIWLLFLLCQCGTIVCSIHYGIDFEGFISLFMVIAQTFLFLVFRGETRWGEDEVRIVLKGFVYIVLILAIYSFLTERMSVNAILAMNSAYGGSWKSFLVSNHEYGCYLSLAIISAHILYSLTKDMKMLLFIALFAVCLLMTFSRTSYLALAAYFFVYLFFSKRKKGAIALLAVTVFLYMTVFAKSQSISSFLDNIVFRKQGNNDVRFGIYEWAFSFFKSHNILFGSGYSLINNVFYRETGLRGLHNTYLTVLNTGGISMMCFFVTFLIHFIITPIKRRDNDARWMMFLGAVIFYIVYGIPNNNLIFFSSTMGYASLLICFMVSMYHGNFLVNESLE